MKRIVIPIENGKLGKRFRACDYYAVFSLENDTVLSTEAMNLVQLSPERLMARFEDLNIAAVIAAYMEPEIIELLARHKIQVYIGVNISDPEKLVQRYIDGQLLSDQQVMEMYNN